MPVQQRDVAGGEAVPLARWGSGGASVAVLAVHGRGQNPEVMKGYASRFDRRGLAFFAPHAPGDSWYPESFLLPLAVNADMLDSGLDTLDACLDQIRAEGFPPEHIAVWGFSQGACLLAHHLLTRRPAVGAAILFTGGFVGQEPLDLAPGSELAGLPVVLRSIENDPFVPPWKVQETSSMLAGLGAEVDLRIDPGDEHVISDEAFLTSARLLDELGR